MQSAFSEGQLEALGMASSQSSAEQPMAMTQEDLESRFVSLTAAFKTDALTMARRVELHRRQRDSLEESTRGEIRGISGKLDGLMKQSLSKDVRETLGDIGERMDVLEKLVTKVAGKAEAYGAVQQEEKLGQSVDILMMYVESLKRLYAKETTRHEHTRKQLEQAKVWAPADGSANGNGEAVNVNITRRLSASGKSGQPVQTGSRRASLTLSALPSFIASNGQLDIKQLTNSFQGASEGHRRISLSSECLSRLTGDGNYDDDTEEDGGDTRPASLAVDDLALKQCNGNWKKGVTKALSSDPMKSSIPIIVVDKATR